MIEFDKLAVLIPAYNDSDALNLTLKSIKENNNDFLVLVVDDGSAIPISINYEDFDFNIKLIRLRENQGITGALNAGLDYLINNDSVRFIARLDCGDLNANNRFEKQLNEFNADPDLMMLGSNVEFFDYKNKENNFSTSLSLTDSQIKKRLWLENSFVHPTVVFDKSVFQIIGLYDPEQKHIEDFALFRKIIKNFKVKNVKDIMVRCEIRESGISCLREKEQAISGLKYKLSHCDLKDIYWYVSIIKSIIRIALGRNVMNRFKKRLGLID